jgi:hypothetical protein
MTHDYKRNGTATLFAALNLLDGNVVGRCMRRHRHQEFIRFLNAVERFVPAGKVVHAIVDNYAAQKQPNVFKWFAIIRAGHSISRRLGFVAQRCRGLPSPPSHAAKSDAEPSIPSKICRTRSHATSTPTTAIVGLSNGPLPLKRLRSSKNSLRSLYLLSESVH